jgi:GT2 family glycosyltransferase
MTLAVSVVVPTYRRPELLGRCLTGLAAQDMTAEHYEILVADDADDEATRRQVETLATRAKCAVRYLPVKGAHGPAAARNVGWRAARAPVIAFTDDDTIPQTGWLTAGVGAFRRDADLAAVTGRMIVPLPDRPTDYERNEAGLEHAEFVTANCFCRRDVLETLGGFDERFTAAWREDSDLHFRLLQDGAKLMKVPAAVVVHPARPAPWGISLRMQRKSMFDALLYKKHPAFYRKHIWRYPPLDYYLIVLFVAVVLIAGVIGNLFIASLAAVLWTGLMIRFLGRRLRGTSRAPFHILEMLVTSLFIPFLSVFWRLYGAVKYRVWFC